MNRYVRMPGYQRFKPVGRMLIITAAKLPARFHYPDRKAYIPRAYKWQHNDIAAGVLSSTTLSFHWFNRVLSVALYRTFGVEGLSEPAVYSDGKKPVRVRLWRFQAIIKTRLE